MHFAVVLHNRTVQLTRLRAHLDVESIGSAGEGQGWLSLASGWRRGMIEVVGEKFLNPSFTFLVKKETMPEAVPHPDWARCPQCNRDVAHGRTAGVATHPLHSEAARDIVLRKSCPGLGGARFEEFRPHISIVKVGPVNGRCNVVDGSEKELRTHGGPSSFYAHLGRDIRPAERMERHLVLWALSHRRQFGAPSDTSTSPPS